jgi:hemerythrin-like domain-containing protein
LYLDHDVAETAEKLRNFPGVFFMRENMRCTELVIGDHTIIRRGLAVVDGMLKKLEDGQRIEILDASTILKFLRLFGDQYHQAMEEHVLFPALLRVAPHDTTLRQLASEHGDERLLVAQIEEAMMSKRGMVFFRSSRQLTTLLRNHCDREETILCNLAEPYLSVEQDEAIVAEFTKNREPVAAFANFSRLERKYAPKPVSQTGSSVAVSF